MDVGMDWFLDCANRAFYLPHMCIMQCEVNCGGKEIVLYALKFHVAVYVDNVETTCMIQLYGVLKLAPDSLLLLVQNQGDGAELQFLQNCVEERVPLYVKKVGT